jgi:hypothetical protein
MPLQDQNDKRTPDPHIGEPAAIEHNVPAGKYSLESIMALQKALEHGLADDTAYEATLLAERPVAVTENQPRTPFVRELFGEIMSDCRDLADRLRLLLKGGRKSRATGKGSSARHTG